jgi:hypothetical protein
LQKDFDMDKINDFLNHKLPENFFYEEDFVMEKLSKCIDKLTNYKFESGNGLLEAIPANELPNVPFGDFKVIDRDALMMGSQRSNSLKPGQESTDREEQLKEIARTRLENEKKNREERKRKRREEKQRAEKSLDDKLMKINGRNGKKPEENGDDDDTDDDDSDEDEDEDTDDDDLNPSKLSEYDDDKCDKESMLSNLTRESSLQKSLNDIRHSQSSLDAIVNGGSPMAAKNPSNGGNLAAAAILSGLNKTSKSSFSNSSFMNQTSEYENLKSNVTATNGVTKPNSPSTIVSHHYNSNSLQFQTSKPPVSSSSSSSVANVVPKTTSTASISQLTSHRTSIPSSQSYMNPIASIISNPPLSPTYKQTTNNQNIASIRTNPDYYINSNGGGGATRYLPTKMNEYVRSPHGIYTRVNVPPLPMQAAGGGGSTINRSPSYRVQSSSSSSSSGIPQSTSTVTINQSTTARPVTTNAAAHESAAPVGSNKRAASLRSIQKSHFDLLGNSYSNSNSNYAKLVGSSSAAVAGSSSSSGIAGPNNYIFTPTKLQLENHSLRIANIQNQHQRQQQQQQRSQNFSSGSACSMTVISQVPNRPPPIKVQHQSQQQQAPLNQRFNLLEISPNNYEKPSSAVANSAAAMGSLNASNKYKYDNKEIIEQYDYI